MSSSSGAGGAEADDEGPANKKQCVALTRADEAHVSQGNNIIIGKPLSEYAVDRSELLAGIANTSGQAALPGNISPEDVKLWEAACSIDLQMTADELVTVIKVADVLGDPEDWHFVAALAGKAVAADWHDTQQRDNMTCTLLRLRYDLLHRVLRCCGNGTLIDVHLYRKLPVPLQQALLSSSITDKVLALRMHTKDDATTMLSHLPSFAATHKDLEELRIYYQDTALQPVMGSWLALATASYPCLKAMHFTPLPLAPAFLHTFHQCLQPGSLPNLVQISLHLKAQPYGCREAVTCFSMLQSLTCITVEFVANRHKDIRNRESMLSMYSGLAASPALLPNLKQLCLEDSPERSESGPQAETSGAVQDDELCTQACCIPLFLSLIRAPVLSEMELALYPVHIKGASLLHLYSMSRFPELENLSVSGIQSLPDLEAVAGDKQMHGFVGPPLTLLEFSGACGMSLPVCAAALCKGSTSSLQELCLKLSIDEEDEFAPACTFSSAPKFWDVFFKHLRKCIALRSLELQCVHGMEQQSGADFSAGLRNALVRLTQLTQLVLSTSQSVGCRGETVNLRSAAIGSALAALTGLQKLELRGLSVDGDPDMLFDDVAPILRACANLKQAAHVSLMFADVTVADLRTAVFQMPLLKTLSLTPDLEDDPGLQVIQRQLPQVRFDFD